MIRGFYGNETFIKVNDEISNIAQYADDGLNKDYDYYVVFNDKKQLPKDIEKLFVELNGHVYGGINCRIGNEKQLKSFGVTEKEMKLYLQIQKYVDNPTEYKNDYQNKSIIL